MFQANRLATRSYVAGKVNLI